MDIAGLRQFRQRLDSDKGSFFKDWPTTPEAREACWQNLAGSLDDLIGLGPDAPEVAASDVLRRCIERYNDLDDGFIGTVEREELCDLLYQVGELCG